MIDFHCHLLPGIDDGAANWTESLAIAGCLQRAGFTGAIATPHYLAGYLTPEKSKIKTLVDELRNRLADAGIELNVFPGSEVQICPELPELVGRGEVLTINDSGRYLLVEMPFGELPLCTDQVIFQLKLNGVTPIIAHPERNSIFSAEPERLLELVRGGCLLQVNIGSFCGFFGGKAERTARNLARYGMVHFFGSDLHRSKDAEQVLKALPAALGCLDGPEAVGELTKQRPEQVLAGAEVAVSIPENPGLLDRLLGRW